MEQAASGFLAGYAEALHDPRPEPLAGRLDRHPSEVRGFAYEGAGLGLALLDALTPWQRGRLKRFLAGPGGAHTYVLHVGAGWTLARPIFSTERLLARLDPLLRWLALNGLGFYYGYFEKGSMLAGRPPRRLGGYAGHALDQGFGRSLWFTEPDAAAIGRAVAGQPADRQADLWSGVGEAAAYAGGRDRAEIEALRRLAGSHLPCLAQGAAFAAEVRVRSGCPGTQTDLACEVLCGRGTDEAARLLREARRDLPPDGEVPAFEVWRRRIQARLG
jgi:hypothetical protein